MAAHFGRTASIDSDVLLMMVDPMWELPEDEWDLELSGWKCWPLTRSFLTHGFDTVIIGSNGCSPTGWVRTVASWSVRL